MIELIHTAGLYQKSATFYTSTPRDMTTFHRLQNRLEQFNSVNNLVSRTMVTSNQNLPKASLAVLLFIASFVNGQTQTFFTFCRF